MNEIKRRLLALEITAKRHGACITVQTMDGQTLRLNASDAIEFVRDGKARSVSADESYQCGELVQLLTGLIGGYHEQEIDG